MTGMHEGKYRAVRRGGYCFDQLIFSPLAGDKLSSTLDLSNIYFFTSEKTFLVEELVTIAVFVAAPVLMMVLTIVTVFAAAPLVSAAPAVLVVFLGATETKKDKKQ